MAFWKKLFGDAGSGRVDYYREGVDLLADDKFHEALTSFRLALKESPGDTLILQQIAICYTRIGMTEEAAKTYRHVLQKEPAASSGRVSPRRPSVTSRRSWRRLPPGRRPETTSPTPAPRWRT
jgi:tetratricopeptide (TPR) repeat protein